MKCYTSLIETRFFTRAAMACLVVSCLGTVASGQITNATVARQVVANISPIKSVVQGKVISWDRALLVLVVEIAGKVRRLKVTPGMFTSRIVNGRALEPTPGQEISIVFKGSADGDDDVVQIIIVPSKAPLEATGLDNSGRLGLPQVPLRPSATRRTHPGASFRRIADQLGSRSRTGISSSIQLRPLLRRRWIVPPISIVRQRTSGAG